MRKSLSQGGHQRKCSKCSITDCTLTAPHRWYALEEREHGVNELRVVGGVCDCCLEAIKFYDGITSLPSENTTSQ